MNYTVTGSTRSEGPTVKGSRFIVDIAPAVDEDVARDHLARVAAEFADASHHCWAWRIAAPAIDRASDDGEPSGSAGRPILAQLTGRDLVNTAVVVTRYFGGTKLGVGGLVRAYGGAAGAALDAVELVPWKPTTQVSFCHDYSLTDAMERSVTEAGGTIVDRSFGEVVTTRVELPVDCFDDFATAIANASAGAVVVPRDPDVTELPH